MTRKEIASEFMKGYDCSQVVLREVAKEVGITIEEANKVASCFGGGMMMGEVCGVVTGALMAIGLKYGHSNPENIMDQKKIVMEKSAMFREKFAEKHGTVICRPLLGYDVSKPEELNAALESGRMLDFCPMLAEEAITILKEIL